MVLMKALPNTQMKYLEKQKTKGDQKLLLLKRLDKTKAQIQRLLEQGLLKNK